MTKEEFLMQPKSTQAAWYAIDKKKIDKLFFNGQHYNRARNIERHLTKKIGVRQVKKLALKARLAKMDLPN